MTAPPDRSTTGNLPILFQSGLDLNVSPELFHTPDRKGYATIPVGDHMETHLINSQEFSYLLHGDYYRTYGKPLSRKLFREILTQLSTQALYDGQIHTVHVRVAHKRGNIYVDLANAQWQVVEITPSGWQVVDNPPVKFRRPEGLSSHPTPTQDGSLEDLRPFINCHDEDWPLVLAWLLGAYSKGPYPLMVLQGEQGTAKTTTARILKSLVDPSQLSQSASPRSPHDLFIAATKSWCLSFDNMSGISNSLSDAFCQLTRGSGMRTRQLYRDTDEIFLKAKRPVILNGIDNMLHRGDLAERAILLELPSIDEEDRRTEEQLLREFKTVLPGILGALFTALSTALSNFSKVKLPTLPRMADFAKWVVAAEPALPWEPWTFWEAYEKNREGIVETSLDDDPLAMVIFELLERRKWVGDNKWEGPSTVLLEVLTAVAGGNTGTGWPKAANILVRKLNRLTPFMRKKGVIVDTKGWTGKSKKVTLQKIT